MGASTMQSPETEAPLTGEIFLDIVKTYVSLDGNPESPRGYCPLCHGDERSFVVRPGDGGWHCFNCGQGGNVFDFIEKLRHVSHHDARRFVEILTQSNASRVYTYKEELKPRGADGHKAETPAEANAATVKRSTQSAAGSSVKRGIRRTKNDTADISLVSSEPSVPQPPKSEQAEPKQTKSKKSKPKKPESKKPESKETESKQAKPKTSAPKKTESKQAKSKQAKSEQPESKTVKPSLKINEKSIAALRARVAAAKRHAQAEPTVSEASGAAPAEPPKPVETEPVKPYKKQAAEKSAVTAAKVAAAKSSSQIKQASAKVQAQGSDQSFVGDLLKKFKGQTGLHGLAVVSAKEDGEMLGSSLTELLKKDVEIIDGFAREAVQASQKILGEYDGGCTDVQFSLDATYKAEETKLLWVPVNKEPFRCNVLLMLSENARESVVMMKLKGFFK